jgi:Protein of unknown function (DUF2934)
MAQDDARRTRVRKKKDDKKKKDDAFEQAPPAATTRAAGVTRSRSRKRAVEAPSTEAVALHAYLLWEQGEPGDATEHWLRAERELAPV